MRKSNKQIEEYLEEALDKVWYIRSINTNKDEITKLKREHPDIYEGMMESRKRVEDTYGTEWTEELDSWNYGFLSGVLATLRWVMGSDDKMELYT